MSNGSQAAQLLRDDHHSTLHAFFLAAKESGYNEFELQLVASPKGRIEFCISPREHSEMSAKFEVGGNTVRAAAGDASVVSIEDADVRLEYGGTRSGEEPVRNGYPKLPRCLARTVPELCKLRERRGATDRPLSPGA